MADEDLVHKVRELGDIDLAALLCLISREHCIISTDSEHLDDLTVELQLVTSRTFGLSSAVVDCTPETTLDDLVAAIQLPQPQSQPQSQSKPTPVSRTPSPLHARGSEHFSAHHGSGSGSWGAHSHANSQQHQHGSLRPPSSRSPSAAVVSSSKASLLSTATQQQQIANIILARNLDAASKALQIQCLELMRTRRIFTRTAVHPCPKQFLLIAVLGSESAGQARLTKHLNDHFYISHWQDPEDGFVHMEEEEGEKEEKYPDVNDNTGDADDVDGNREDRDDDTASQASLASVVRRTRSPKPSLTPIPTPTIPASPGPGQHISTIDWAIQNQRSSQTTNSSHGNNNGTISMGRNQLFTETDISTLSTLSLQTHVDIEVQRYQMNIIAFLRLHRAVAPGSVPPAATTHFRMLVRSLAALHGLDFVTPELVQLAARKIYAHRIIIVPAERERSMQWGSDLAAVKVLLEDMQPEDVVEDVLGMVDVPL